jgi:hypothetical protein
MRLWEVQSKLLLNRRYTDDLLSGRAAGGRERSPVDCGREGHPVHRRGRGPLLRSATPIPENYAALFPRIGRWGCECACMLMVRADVHARARHVTGEGSSTVRGERSGLLPGTHLYKRPGSISLTSKNFFFFLIVPLTAFAEIHPACEC